MRPNLDDALGRGFFERHVTEVAHDLLGCYLVRRTRDRITGGRIVEVEAYGGPGDPGSHADRAPNGRARIMFGPAGIAYVYLSYGLHHCMNAVTGKEGEAGAVLIRALEPMWGVQAMRRGAPTTLPDPLVASGPGRLCRALGIDRELNGTDLVSGPIWVLRSERSTADDRSVVVHRGVRVGLTRDDGREWRYWAESAAVSRTRRHGRRPSPSSR